MKTIPIGNRLHGDSERADGLVISIQPKKRGDLYMIAESDGISYKNRSRATASKKIVPTEEQPQSKPFNDIGSVMIKTNAT
jgi:hypothetical protein